MINFNNNEWWAIFFGGVVGAVTSTIISKMTYDTSNIGGFLGLLIDAAFVAGFTIIIIMIGLTIIKKVR